MTKTDVNRKPALMSISTGREGTPLLMLASLSLIVLLIRRAGGPELALFQLWGCVYHRYRVRRASFNDKIPRVEKNQLWATRPDSAPRNCRPANCGKRILQQLGNLSRNPRQSIYQDTGTKCCERNCIQRVKEFRSVKSFQRNSYFPWTNLCLKSQEPLKKRPWLSSFLQKLPQLHRT